MRLDLSGLKEYLFQNFPSLYINVKAVFFDKKKVIYKGLSYQNFLEQAFRDFKPEIKYIQRIKLERDILKSFLVSKVRPDEFFLFKFENKSIIERDEYIAQASKDVLLVRYYKGDVENTINILRDKYLFYQSVKNFFKRDVILISNEIDNKAEFKSFCEKHHKFIAKVVNGGCGVGVRVVDTSSYNSCDEIYNELSTSANSWIIEELIKQNKEIANFNESSVNTIRLPSFRHGNNVFFSKPCMRFGRKGNIVDNAGQKGVFVSVDVNTGMIITDAYDEHGHKYYKHPDSEIIFNGFIIPKWSELLETAKNAHLSLSEKQVYVAFDFALSDNGWVVVEGNWGDWVLQQVSLEKGLKKEFIKLLNNNNEF